MSTAYYFVPKKKYRNTLTKIEKQLLSDVYSIYQKASANIKYVLPCEIHKLFPQINEHYEDELTSIFEDLQHAGVPDKKDEWLTFRYRIHIGSVSCFHVALLQACDQFKSMNELQQFSKNNKKYLDCVDEYNMKIDFKDLKSRIDDTYNKNYKTHKGYGFDVFSDEDGYEFTYVDFL